MAVQAAAVEEVVAVVAAVLQQIPQATAEQRNGGDGFVRVILVEYSNA
jgi:hypothetical protein